MAYIPDKVYEEGDDEKMAELEPPIVSSPEFPILSSEEEEEAISPELSSSIDPIVHAEEEQVEDQEEIPTYLEDDPEKN